jgi:hypothetical protein
MSARASAKSGGRALTCVFLVPCGVSDGCGHWGLDGRSQAHHHAEDHTRRCDLFPQPLPVGQRPVRPRESPTKPSAKTPFIRGRNVLAIAVAASTVGHGSADVLVGSLATDPHSDCKQPFFDEITRALKGPDFVGRVRVSAPLLAG